MNRVMNYEDGYDRDYRRERHRVRKYKDTKRLVEELLKYYEYYGLEELQRPDLLLRELMKKEQYTEKEKKDILNNAITILKIKYNIDLELI